MELDRSAWHAARTRVHRTTRVTLALLMLNGFVVPLVAFMFFSEYFSTMWLFIVAALLFAPRLIARLLMRVAAGPAIETLRSQIAVGGPPFTRKQVERLLRDGAVAVDGGRWVSVHDGDRVRLILEGSEPGSRAQQSSPWVWAMGNS